MASKRSKRNRNPSGKKNVKIGASRSIPTGNIVWRTSGIDSGGCWSWNQLKCSEFLRDVWEKMRQFEASTWDSLNHKVHHMIPVRNIVAPARERLKELGRDDLEWLASFHFNGKKRIWAHRTGNEFWLLWWDPNHEVCPSLKKGT